MILNLAKSQTISPSQNNEYCPGTEYTFTVTIAKPYSSMIGEGGCYVTQLPTSPVGSSFTFKGKFADANLKQTFRIIHPDNSSTPFDFKKIKSLFYSTTSCAPIQPNQGTITAPRCQAQSFPISFSNIQWGTAFESPSICFGSVTNYQYLLPNGWSMGGQTSNGSNWISGGSSTTVTSDLTTGGAIRIRPVNTACGTGLSTGPEAVVNISRPAPSISISPSGTQAFICSGTKTFTLSALPPGAVVNSWVISDPSLATVPNGSTGTSVVVTKVGGDGRVTLTANVTQCGTTYQIPVTINLGANVPATYNVSSNTNVSYNNQYQYYTNPPPPYGLGYAYLHANETVLFISYINNSFLTNPTWTVSGTYNSFSSSSGSFNLYMTAPNSGYYSRNSATVKLTANSACGVVNKTYILQAILSYSAYKIVASPNPATNNINVSIKEVADTSGVTKTNEQSLNSSNTTNITKMYLYDFNTGVLLKQWSFKESKSNNYNLNVASVSPGAYVLKMERNNKIATTKIIVNYK